MATLAPDASIEELDDDLQLHLVILQSLEEQRPDAIEEIQEILGVIQDLQTRLTILRGEPRTPAEVNPRSTRLSTSYPDLALAQLDGAGDVWEPMSPPRWGSSAMSPPRQPPQPRLRQQSSVGGFQECWSREHAHGDTNGIKNPGSYDDDDLDRPAMSSSASVASSSAISPPRQSSHSRQQTGAGRAGRSLGSLAIRKRTRDDLSSDGSVPLHKRISSNRRPSTSSTASAHSQREGQPADDDIEGLRRLLGLDNDDTLRALQEEQRQAEQWLEERREQERRDEEYARMLTDGLYEPPRPASARSTTSTHYSGSSIPFPPDGPATNQRETETPFNLTQRRSGDRQPSELSHPSNGISSSGPGRAGAHHHPIVTIGDSDDSDIAEITPRDFQHHRAASSIHSARYLAPNYRAGPSYSPNRQGLGPRSPGMLPPTSERGAMFIPGSVYGPNVLQSTMARLNASRQMLEHAGRSIVEGFSSYFSPSGSSKLPGGYPYGYDPSMSHYYNDFNEPAVDPKQVNEEIKQLLETIRPDSELAKEKREGTPEALRYTLLEHQKLGLAWMKSMEESDKKGGILADDMGLGKTIQAIALLVSRPSTDPERRPTLIIAPVSLMQQWKREIQKAVKPGRHQLSVYVLHGEKRTVGWRDLKNHDVVLTTFGTLSSELKRREKYDELQGSGANNEASCRTLAKSLPCLGPGSTWYRVIIDEAQCIKNRRTKSALACCRLNSTYRWCMSGTPMMNSVEELQSLLRFLQIRPYSSIDRFNKDFTTPLKSGNEEMRGKAMKQLQVLLKAVLLRRTKTSKIDGKPILELPPRVSEKVHAVFSEDEQALYNALESKTKLQFNKYLKANAVGRNYSNILVLLLRLRQACCHPHLMTDFSVEATSNTDEVDFVANAKAFSSDVVVRLKENENLECPICIDAVDNPIIFFPCGHSACAECFSRMTDPSVAVQRGEDGSVEIKCPNCRGKVDPKKVTDHQTFKKTYFPDSDDGDEVGLLKPLVEEEENDESDDDSDDDGSLSRFIVDDEDNESGAGSSKKPMKKKGKKAKKTRKTLAELKKEASKNQKSKKKYLRRLEKTWVTSAKIEKTLEILQEIGNRDDSEKTIIFSQFTSLLDLLEVPIARRGWGYRRYDGSMKPADRNSAVLDFTDNADCKIMLVSLKAGNSGLNLVAASQVIIFDPFWNPYIEEQAIDRAHRIGQRREVQIHRVLVQKTVEDRILELQDKKRELIEGALDEKALKQVSRLGTRELAYLFGVN
ncbi:DEAD/DEAH box helicase [Aspergillus clavatus NRRL 1]|uniref:SWI/SNF family DNA-dependent ATPase Ris1, putative n=1 Tax=Aspergillus clavatus (strain ATCC 1007 / CBS 513.65 / DSM 816 / NCTC 3887 / NRRL 1 / QM 1276 / 107) TaxID=344612 RepID=A1CUG8_ASPCL|nr:SWI/SNF family DNA-dependent ATPase Ris1, putative [Aspergillus clavatus NRRL 1]EAW06955.1 SWI/SNF family DNA-dependent ATPase Ris1, putative [Aspergillus clavatus NRRL 1]